MFYNTIEVILIYTNFAYFYDKLMKDVDYPKWADYIEKIFAKYKIRPSLMLDLGCGTGSMCVEMAGRGYEMIGTDISEDMLSCAREKLAVKGLDVLLLNQDMVSFELYGTVDAIISLVDSVNYITDKRDLKRMFKLVNNYLNPGGLFIFDINSVYKFENILADNVFYSVEDEICYIWQNSFDRKTVLCEFDLTFFVQHNAMYQRFDEIHHERAYTSEEIRQAVEASGLEFCAEYGAFSLKPPAGDCERIFFVCRKKQE